MIRERLRDGTEVVIRMVSDSIFIGQEFQSLASHEGKIWKNRVTLQINLLLNRGTPDLPGKTYTRRCRKDRKYSNQTLLGTVDE